MKILHYSLGFPPYRSGGLTMFCMGLMEQQVKEGHDVSLIWPGAIKIFDKTTRVIKHESVKAIDSYEVINPCPVPYDEGIKEFDVYMQEGDKEVYEVFLAKLMPDVIHVHTFMGLHKNLLTVAGKAGIKLIFSTHDYFPICPKVTLFRNGTVCDTADTCKMCGKCNNTALSLNKIYLLQSALYRNHKDDSIVKILRKRHRDNFFESGKKFKSSKVVGSERDYHTLRNYYLEMLSSFDLVHYNSLATKNIYERFCDIPNSRVIYITQFSIADKRKKKVFRSTLLRIRYLGTMNDAKGFSILKESLDMLWNEHHNFVLDIHFQPKQMSPYMRIHSRYNDSELEGIFDETDVLVAPSIWYETFGYTVLEALCYGVPVIVSDKVGAKDIMADGAGIIIDDISADKLLNVFRNMDTDTLQTMNKAILEKQKILTMEEMSEELSCLYSCSSKN